jgi:hypothetical protein
MGPWESVPEAPPNGGMSCRAPVGANHPRETATSFGWGGRITRTQLSGRCGKPCKGATRRRAQVGEMLVAQAPASTRSALIGKQLVEQLGGQAPLGCLLPGHRHRLEQSRPGSAAHALVDFDGHHDGRGPPLLGDGHRSPLSRGEQLPKAVLGTEGGDSAHKSIDSW